MSANIDHIKIVRGWIADPDIGFEVRKLAEGEAEFERAKKKVAAPEKGRAKMKPIEYCLLVGIVGLSIGIVALIEYPSIKEARLRKQEEARTFQQLMEETQCEPLVEAQGKWGDEQRNKQIISRLIQVLEKQNQVHIAVSQSFNGGAVRFSLPVEEKIANICCRWRVRDISFQVTISGEAIGTYYRKRALVSGWGFKLYTGCRLWGVISARQTQQGGEVFQRSFGKTITPLYSVRAGADMDSPEKAPFREAFNDSFLPELERLLAEINGSP